MRGLNIKVLSVISLLVRVLIMVASGDIGVRAQGIGSTLLTTTSTEGVCLSGLFWVDGSGEVCALVRYIRVHTHKQGPMVQ